MVAVMGAGVALMGSSEAADGVGRVRRPLKPLKPRQCHKYLQETLAEEFPKILAGFLVEAEKGGCAHMKLAVELLEESKPEPRPQKGSARRLLEELGEGYGRG